MSALAEVAVGVFGLGAADRLGLFQDLCKRVAVVWIAGNRHRPEHPVCPRCRHEACLHAELVARVDLALGDALDLRLVLKERAPAERLPVTTVVLAIDRLERFFETPPVDRIPQQDQLVLRIDDIPQQHLEEVRLNGGGGVTFRHHFRGAPLQFTWFYARCYNILRANNQRSF